MPDPGVLLLALLTVDPARLRDFEAYEAEVLPLLARHGAALRHRLRVTDPQSGDPTEVHLLWFPDEAALAAYRADPARAAAAARHVDLPIREARLRRVASMVD